MKRRVLTHVVAEVSSAPETKMTCASSTAGRPRPHHLLGNGTAPHTTFACNHFTFAKDGKGVNL